MVKKGSRLKKLLIAGSIATSLTIGYWASQAFYTVSKVIDGDTFETPERQIVRLDGINAPETDRCLGMEAKKELENLILKKKVFLKVSYINNFRLIASVYTLEGNVGAKMLEKGLATYETKGHSDKSLLKISQDSRKKKIGIHSETCTQTINPINPKCNIKGNARQIRLYHYPGCRNYDTTLVQLYLGDEWFCSIKEAEAARYTKGGDCL